MWELTHSAPLLGLLNFLLTAPMLALPLLAGARLHPATARRDTLRILSCSFGVAILLLIGAVAYALTPTALLFSAAALGIIGSIELPARQLLLTSSLESKALLPNAVAMNTMVYNIGRMIGPAVAAAAFSHGGAMAGFAINVCGLMVMLLSVHALNGQMSAGTSRQRSGSVRDALALIKADPFTQRYLPLLVGLGLFVGSYQTMIPVLSAKEFESTSKYTGIFFGCAGAGALSAAVLLSARPAALIWNRMLANAPWFSVAALLGVAASPSSSVTGACFWILGVSLAFTTTRINATIQRRSPDHLRGTAVGLYAVCFLGTMPIGHLIVGTAAGWIGPRWTFAAMATCLACLQGLLVARRCRLRS